MTHSVSTDRARMDKEPVSRAHPRRQSGGYHVVQEENEAGETLHVVVAPTGVALYSFTDVHDATAEAAALNRGRSG